MAWYNLLIAGVNLIGCFVGAGINTLPCVWNMTYGISDVLKNELRK